MFLSRCGVLLLCWMVFGKTVSETDKKMPGEGDEVGDMVEASNHGLKIRMSDSSSGGDGLNIAGPCEELIKWENDEETSGIERPAQDILDFHW